MNKSSKLSALLTTAVVAGLFVSQAAQAKDPAPKASDQVTEEKNECKGHGEKNTCKNGCAEEAKKKKKADDKNACNSKNGCGETESKK